MNIRQKIYASALSDKNCSIKYRKALYNNVGLIEQWIELDRCAVRLNPYRFFL